MLNILRENIFISQQCHHILFFLVEYRPKFFLIWHFLKFSFWKRCQWVYFCCKLFLIHPLFHLQELRTFFSYLIFLIVFMNNFPFLRQQIYWIVYFAFLKLHKQKITNFLSWQKCKWHEWRTPFGIVETALKIDEL